MRWPLYAAWACAAAAVAGAVGAFLLRAADPAPDQAAPAVLLEIAIGVPALAAGVAIARGRPRNPVGAVGAAIGLAGGAHPLLGGGAGKRGRRRRRNRHGGGGGGDVFSRPP
ncbi:MAG TPA: hypothetical protein PKD59_13415 [Miltoncostaeaceae bacterium]|nr:hypothetical protein [Miltoncostaeaceae bacterium]